MDLLSVLVRPSAGRSLRGKRRAVSLKKLVGSVFRPILAYREGSRPARKSLRRAARGFAKTLSWEAVLDGMRELHPRLAGVRPDLVDTA